MEKNDWYKGGVQDCFPGNPLDFVQFFCGLDRELGYMETIRKWLLFIMALGVFLGLLVGFYYSSVVSIPSPGRPGEQDTVVFWDDPMMQVFSD